MSAAKRMKRKPKLVRLAGSIALLAYTNGTCKFEKKGCFKHDPQLLRDCLQAIEKKTKTA